MLVQRRLLRLLAAKQTNGLTTCNARQCFSSDNIVTSEQIAKDAKLQEQSIKFEEDWVRVHRETEEKQRQALNSELTASQIKRVDSLSEALLSLNTMEVRFFNHLVKQRLLKSTGVSPLRVNVDWPSIKQLENGTWPPSNAEQQQEAIAKLWPTGQAGLQQLFGGMGGGSSFGSGAPAAGAAAEAAKVEEKPVEEAPKEKQNYDIELASIDAASKIKIIKEVRSLFGLGLKEAKDMVEKTPCVLKTGVKKSEADELKEKLIAIGCAVNLL